MADRFPSLEDFSAGEQPASSPLLLHHDTNPSLGQTEVVETNGGADENDFLARERAMLGDDAEQFATPQDHVAATEDVNNDDDLLGGADAFPAAGDASPNEIGGFESSFPALDTQNEVRIVLNSFNGHVSSVLMYCWSKSKLPLVVQSLERGPPSRLLDTSTTLPKLPTRSLSPSGKHHPRLEKVDTPLSPLCTAPSLPCCPCF